MAIGVKCFRCDGMGYKNGKSHNGQRYRCSNPKCPHPSFEYDFKTKLYHYPYIKSDWFTFIEAKKLYEKEVYNYESVINDLNENVNYFVLLRKHLKSNYRHIEYKSRIKKIIRPEELYRKSNRKKRTIEIIKKKIINLHTLLQENETAKKQIDDEYNKLIKELKLQADKL